MFIFAEFYVFKNTLKQIVKKMFYVTGRCLQCMSPLGLFFYLCLYGNILLSD